MTTPDLRHTTVTWLSALLDSASTDVIGVTNWWTRATSALETAATAPTYGAAVSTGTRKLQIETLTDKSSTTLASLEKVMSPHMAEWAEIVHTEAPYLVALTRIHRQARKATK